MAGIKRLEFFPERTYEDITPHIARKSFATAFIRSGGDIIRLKGILGHENINTTMVYLGMVRAELDDSDTEMGLYNSKPAPNTEQSHPQPIRQPQNDYPTPMHAEKKGFDMAYM